MIEPIIEPMIEPIIELAGVAANLRRVIFRLFQLVAGLRSLR
jgi:hypothetical protein